MRFRKRALSFPSSRLSWSWSAPFRFSARIGTMNPPPAPPRSGAARRGQFPSWKGSGVGLSTTVHGKSPVLFEMRWDHEPVAEGVAYSPQPVASSGHWPTRQRLGLRREAKRHAALDSADLHTSAALPPPPECDPKRRRRCALPAHSKTWRGFQRFMESPLSVFFRMHWDHEPADRAIASWSAPVLWRFRLARLHCQSARGLAHSKTWRGLRRFMESAKGAKVCLETHS